MTNNFTRVFNQVCDQVQDKIKQDNCREFYYILDISVGRWCQELNCDQNIVNAIDRGYKISEIEELTNYLWQDWQPPKRQFLMVIQEDKGKLFKIIKPIFDRLNIPSDNDIKFITFLAFVITAVGYWIYILNKPKQQEPTTRQPDYTATPSQQPSYQVSQPASTVSPPAPVQPIVKKLLILVVSAAQQSIVDSIKAKGKIDYDDCEKLYKATQCLCQDTEPNLSPKLDNINQFQALEKSESEYDIYLITIELNQANEGFNKNVNQLDRYDAFRNLANLAVNVQVSGRLQMEAYGNFDVYNR